MSLKPVSIAGTLAFLVLTPSAIAQAPTGDREAVRAPARDAYVVSFASGVFDVDRAVRNRERRDGFRSRHRYRSALKGFSARLAPGQVRRLQADPEIATVMRDRPVHTHAGEPLALGETAPTGVDRIEAFNEGNTAGPAGVGVAVLDTGIDTEHPDLAGTVAGGTNCIDGTQPPEDDHGHGTHVAGTIAARNDGAGVVGVAPGTRLYSVKVLDSRGSGSMSTVICGIDWVTANAGVIGVANMSLGGAGQPIEPCSDSMADLEHAAICESTTAGVLYVVAAGNSGWDFDYAAKPDIPAAYPEVVTVSAASDTDGAPGGLGADCGGGSSLEADDRYASFSNFASTPAGRAHTIAAPGACIESTALGGGTTRMSGTSMATPHVAAAAALCLTAGTCSPGAGPATVIAAISADSDGAYGFAGDPANGGSLSRYYGHLTRVATAPLAGDGAGTEDPGSAGPGAEDPATEAISLTASPYKVKGGQHVDLAWSGGGASEVDVYRDDRRIATTGNDGAYTDAIGRKGGGSYRYKVCDTAATRCSAEAIAGF